MREFEVDEFGKLHLIENKQKKPIFYSGSIEFDSESNSYYALFIKGLLVSISRIEYTMIYKRPESEVFSE